MLVRCISEGRKEKREKKKDKIEKSNVKRRQKKDEEEEWTKGKRRVPKDTRNARATLWTN